VAAEGHDLEASCLAKSEHTLRFHRGPCLRSVGVGRAISPGYARHCAAIDMWSTWDDLDVSLPNAIATSECRLVNVYMHEANGKQIYSTVLDPLARACFTSSVSLTWSQNGLGASDMLCSSVLHFSGSSIQYPDVRERSAESVLISLGLQHPQIGQLTSLLPNGIQLLISLVILSWAHSRR
jgi:hypothetical protein